MFLLKYLKLEVRLITTLTALILCSCGGMNFTANSSGQLNTTPNINPTPQGNTLGNTRDVHYNQSVVPTENKVDIVLIIDDSNSMLQDNQKLAANLTGFVNKLQNSNLDWQMCVTVTRALAVSETRMAWGASMYWQNSSSPSTSLGLVLKKGANDLPNIFSSTINYIGAGWQGADDERAIKSAYHHVYNGDYRYQPNSGCYRQDSAVAYIIISDEDERSVGGDASQQVYENELQPLEEDDKPEVFVSYFKETFGGDRRFSVNSIIVKPGDSTCKSSQDASGTKSHYGFKYAELSRLTGGGIGSICESDYSTTLNLFFDRIKDSLSSIPLECVPVNGEIKVQISPTMENVSTRLDGMSLIFSTPIPSGKTIDLQYKCFASDRSPSSVSSPISLQELSLWGKIMAFFQGLFQ